MVELRTPKGTVDHSPKDARKMAHIAKVITRIFEEHGGQPISTPTFELRSLLLNKYGEEGKLIYNLEEQGGDSCSLRYDLTVPFSRYVASNRITKMRRYQIGSVFRRDNPSFKTGRLREFTQADFDICGTCIPGLFDAEILAMLSAILAQLCPSASFEIRVNDRRILSGMLESCGIEKDRHATVCSTIDKADKHTWSELTTEFIQKGLSTVQTDAIQRYIMRKGSNEELLEFLREESEKSHDKEYIQAVSDLRDILCYAERLGAAEIRVDLSLARGLDYYTGMIIEAGYIGSEVGSVAGGGRYDSLCSSLKGPKVPCVGFSLGVSRVFGLVDFEEQRKGVFIGSASGGCLPERMDLLKELWQAGVRAETFPGTRINFGEHLRAAENGGYAFAAFLGRDEIEKDEVLLIEIESGRRENIPRNEFMNYIKEKLK